MKHLGIDLNATLISEYSKTVSQWHLPKGNKTLQVAMNKVLARMYLSVLEVRRSYQPRNGARSRAPVR